MEFPRTQAALVVGTRQGAELKRCCHPTLSQYRYRKTPAEPAIHICSKSFRWDFPVRRRRRLSRTRDHGRPGSEGTLGRDYSPLRRLRPRDEERADARMYRYEAHNWCFQHNMPNYDLRSRLPGVTCPTLVAVGRTDWVTPVAYAETIASLLLTASLVVFEKSGTRPRSKSTNSSNKVLRDFLQGVTGN